jgi:hypothetical protein
MSQPWVDLLREILTAGVAAGEFRQLDVGTVVLRSYILMDGMSISVLLGLRGYGPKWARAEAMDWFHEATAKEA